MDERLAKAARAVVEHFDGGQLWLSHGDAAVTRLRSAVAALDRAAAEQTSTTTAAETPAARDRRDAAQQGGG